MVFWFAACARRERAELDLVCRARELSGLQQAPFSELARWIDSKLRKEAPVRRIFVASARTRTSADLATELQEYATHLGRADCPLVAEMRAAAVRSASRAPVKGLCEADLQRFCKDAPGGGGERIECLERHLSLLSAGCQGVLRRSAKHPCVRDAVRFCPELGPSRMGRCLEQHRSELSPSCRAQIVAGHRVFESCKAEVDGLCKGGGLASALDCLRARLREVTDTCKEVVEQYDRDYAGD